MEIKKVSVSDIFSWLNASFRLVGNNLRTFIFASLLSLVLIIVIGAIFGMALFGSMDFTPEALAVGPDLQKLIILYAVAILFGLLLMPPFIAGWIKLCQKLANNQSAGATEIFQPYSDAAIWKKLIIYGLLGMILYIAVLAVFMLICSFLGLGKDMQSFMMAQMGGDPGAVMQLPASFWFAYAGIILLGNFLQLMFLLGFSQATLTESSAVDSLKYAIAGVMKNLLSLIGFTLIFLVVAIVAVLLIGLVIGLLLMLLGFIHQALAVTAGIILYAALLLIIYPVMFSFTYFLWKGILGKDEPAITTDTAFLV